MKKSKIKQTINAMLITSAFLGIATNQVFSSEEFESSYPESLSFASFSRNSTAEELESLAEESLSSANISTNSLRGEIEGWDLVFNQEESPPSASISRNSTAEEPEDWVMIEENALSANQIFSKDPNLLLEEQITACLKDFNSIIGKIFKLKRKEPATFTKWIKEEIGDWLMKVGDDIRRRQEPLPFLSLTSVIGWKLEGISSLNKILGAGSRTLGALLAEKNKMLDSVLADMRHSAIGEGVSEEKFWRSTEKALSKLVAQGNLTDGRRRIETKKELKQIIRNAKDKLSVRLNIHH